MTKNKSQRGFSLIELLIVIAIIILLGIISVVALNDQRGKARDAKRISDIRQVRTALEFYYSDENEYPVTITPIILGDISAQKLCSKKAGAFLPAETPCDQANPYMPLVPKDPLASGKYSYTGIAEGYDIVFTTEKPSSLGEAGTYHAHSQAIDRQAGNK
ncbi:MAG: prepilin-type N-terminal cleavage/methylation domain-containing protein [Candidatus Parcubacteria bacterium]|nr:prepilin-type N-terminal cleavage/methylation domain-containing protein [Candidatus Parcubacteria bacterium]